MFLCFLFIDFDNDGLLTASDLGRLIDDLTCTSENSTKLLERDEVVGYVRNIGNSLFLPSPVFTIFIFLRQFF